MSTKFQIPPAGDIITQRRPKQSPEDYHLELRAQKKHIEGRVRKGFIFHKSWEVFTDPVTQEQMIRKYPPYVNEAKQRARAARSMLNLENMPENMNFRLKFAKTK